MPSPEFESVVMGNINRIFGATSASHNFYQQMFTIYKNAPGASAATPGTFNPNDLGCNGWTDPNNPNGLGTKDPCAVHFYQNANGPSNDSIVSGRLDWNLGTGDRLFLLAQYGFGRRSLYIDVVNPVFNGYGNQHTWQSQLSETHTFGTKAANQFLLAATYIYGVSGVADPAKAAAVFPYDFNWWNEGGTFAPVGGEDFQYGLPSTGRTTSYQVSDDLVKTQGKHKFGVGMIFLRTYTAGHSYNWSGTGQILPQTVDAFYWGGVDPDPSKSGHDYTSLAQNYPVISWDPQTFYSLGGYGQDEWQARPNLTLTLAVRADHQSNPVCQTRCFVRLHGPFASINHDPDQPYNQAIVPNQKQGFVHTDSLVWAPRLSFAWQPFGVSHSTVLRGGIGVFYDPVPGGQGNFYYSPPNVNTLIIHGYPLAPGEYNSLSQNSANFNAAFVKGFSSGETLAQIQAANPFFVPPGFVSPPSVYRSPEYQKWSLQAQHGFGASASLTLGYFGHHGIHEFAWNEDLNAFGFGSFPQTKCASPPVPPCYDSRFGQVAEPQTNLVSNYNGLVVSFERRFTGGLFQVNYTYSHGLDEVSNGGYGYFTYSSAPQLQDPAHPRDGYGAADYDVRHSLNANYVLELPLKSMLRSHGPDSIVKGWQVSGTVLARTAFPYTVLDTGEAGYLNSNNNFGNPIYSVPVAPLGPSAPCGERAAIPKSAVPCQPPQLKGNGSSAPGALFVQSGCETGFNTGNVPGSSGPCSGPAISLAQGRNRFRGPDYFNSDFAIVKNTKINHWENAVLTIGAQFFNLFNHANFANPDNWMADQTFGQIYYLEQSPTSILGSGLGANVSQRMIQLRAQIKF